MYVSYNATMLLAFVFEFDIQIRHNNWTSLVVTIT